MRQRMERLLAAGVAAALGCAVLTAAPARAADDGSTGATPERSYKLLLAFSAVPDLTHSK